jgi:hypothetical protein
MSVTAGRLDAFNAGQGIEPPVPPSHCCAECGYESTNRRNFRNADGGKTCSTGHYEKDGELKRQKNPYARSV